MASGAGLGPLLTEPEGAIDPRWEDMHGVAREVEQGPHIQPLESSGHRLAREQGS